MKKLMGAAIALGMASSAFAAASFEYGSIWFFPRYDANYNQEDFTGQGQTFAANWDLDNDLIVGVYSEGTQLVEVDDGYTYAFNVTALNISKGVMKNASVGLHLGNFYEDYNGTSGILTDLFGSVTLMSGGADKVTGSLKATFGGRFARDNYDVGSYYADYSGYFASLGVAVTL